MTVRRWMLLLALVLVGTSLAVGVGILGLYRGWWRLNHPDPEHFPIWGIDVSHHQGAIDWTAVASAPNLAFAYIKATEGGDWIDTRFTQNWRRARAVGLKVGAYHYFTFCRSPGDQAKNFLAVLPREPDTLPPAVDLEFGGNCRARPSPAAVRRDLLVWLAEVERETSRRPVIYATPEAYQAFLAGNVRSYPIWIRDLFWEPDLPDGAPWTFWQFTNRGRVTGISSPVDLNVFVGARAALDAL